MFREDLRFAVDLYPGRSAGENPRRNVNGTPLNAASARLQSPLPTRTGGRTKPRSPRVGATWFPEDAAAIIEQQERSVVQSGKARARGWRLRFRPRSAPFADPLMGWTGSADTLSQVELQFPTLQAAVRYAERQGLTYEVHGSGGPPHPRFAPVIRCGAAALIGARRSDREAA